MHDEVRRLVDDDDVVVLVDHVERDGLGRGLGRLRRRHVEHDGGAGIDAMARIADRAAVDRDRAGLDQRLEPRLRDSSATCAGEHAVEPLAGFLRGDDDSDRRGLRHARYIRVTTTRTSAYFPPKERERCGKCELK